jgi:two-component system, NarL family, response regulator DevR
MGPIRVLLVEDNDVYRDSLAFLLGRVDDLEVAGAVATAAAATRSAAELTPDVAVIDYRLPDENGFEAAAMIRERSPSTAIVFLSASAGDDERDAARRAGADLIGKDDGVDTLVGAVRAAAGRSTA